MFKKSCSKTKQKLKESRREPIIIYLRFPIKTVWFGAGQLFGAGTMEQSFCFYWIFLAAQTPAEVYQYTTVDNWKIQTTRRFLRHIHHCVFMNEHNFHYLLFKVYTKIHFPTPWHKLTAIIH